MELQQDEGLITVASALNKTTRKKSTREEKNMTTKLNRANSACNGTGRAGDLEIGTGAWRPRNFGSWPGKAMPTTTGSRSSKEQTGATVKVVFIGTDDEIWAKIKGSEGKDFDVFAVNTAQLQRYIDAGLTTPHDLTKLPNQKDVLPRFRDLVKVKGVMRDGKVHAIPFCFDSIGIIYDKDKVNPAPIHSRFCGIRNTRARCWPMTMASTISPSPR